MAIPIVISQGQSGAPEGKIVAGSGRSSSRPATQGESSAARARAAVWCVRVLLVRC
jgi:hypothetical protein